MNRYLVSIFTIAMASVTIPALANPDGEKLFNSKCTMCHAIDKNKIGPAVKSMNSDAVLLHTTITKGKNSMPAFEGKLSDAEITALVGFLKANQ